MKKSFITLGPGEIIYLFAYSVILHASLSSADLFQNKLFGKILSEIPSEWQTV